MTTTILPAPSAYADFLTRVGLEVEPPPAVATVPRLSELRLVIDARVSASGDLYVTEDMLDTFTGHLCTETIRPGQ